MENIDSWMSCHVIGISYTIRNNSTGTRIHNSPIIRTQPKPQEPGKKKILFIHNFVSRRTTYTWEQHKITWHGKRIACNIRHVSGSLGTTRTQIACWWSVREAKRKISYEFSFTVGWASFSPLPCPTHTHSYTKYYNISQCIMIWCTPMKYVLEYCLNGRCSLL